MWFGFEYVGSDFHGLPCRFRDWFRMVLESRDFGGSEVVPVCVVPELRVWGQLWIRVWVLCGQG